MLQECHVLNEDLEAWKKEWGMENIYLNPLSTRSAGQTILLKQNREIIEHIILLHGRIQVLKLKMSETILTLVNVYGPNHETDRVPFLDKLQYLYHVMIMEIKS